MEAIRSRTEDHLHNVLSHRSEIRSIDPQHNHGDVDLLAQIGYKQELNRHYSTVQVFGIAFSIMGLLPSISSMILVGLEAGPAGLVWGWLISGLFILSVGASLSFLASSIPTSGGIYYYTNYYCPDALRVPLSFLIGCANTLGLLGGACSITWGAAVTVLAAVDIGQDGNFDITNGKTYGVYAALIVSVVVITCLGTKQAALLQTVSIAVNVFLIILFIIAVPVGKGGDFNDRQFIFGNFENSRNYPKLWSFALSFQPAIWTIGSYDSCIHCAEEAKNAQRSIPIGILGSISVCWILGWIICIVCAACIQDGDVARVIATETGSPMSQIILDCLGKKWAVAIMSLIALGQYLMAISIVIASSRQIWSFARDDGLPIVYNFVKYINPKIKVPVRATFFAGCLCLILGLLALIPGTAGSGALFSLAIMSQSFAFAMPVLLVTLPYGRKLFKPGPFYFGETTWTLINIVTIGWTVFVIIICVFPDSTPVDKETMNYTVVINVGVWILSLGYFFVWGYKAYSGPKSNLDDDYIEGTPVPNVDEILSEKA